MSRPRPARLRACAVAPPRGSAHARTKQAAAYLCQARCGHFLLLTGAVASRAAAVVRRAGRPLLAVPGYARGGRGGQEGYLSRHPCPGFWLPRPPLSRKGPATSGLLLLPPWDRKTRPGFGRGLTRPGLASLRPDPKGGARSDLICPAGAGVVEPGGSPLHLGEGGTMQTVLGKPRVGGLLEWLTCSL